MEGEEADGVQTHQNVVLERESLEGEVVGKLLRREDRELQEALRAKAEYEALILILP